MMYRSKTPRYEVLLASIIHSRSYIYIVRQYPSFQRFPQKNSVLQIFNI